ncbi:hypothetical protein EV200_101656 [Pedobacter psychrotolerans]|uniref:Uncharacterized protein n=1 Tax=Pedobacter psychrotolerans TaxID=1843235 RepID=A0A4R2HM64_9SPHI|nr:hypothetical protein [Pedobacter psychrotolerans]TCO31208.1 hypothetical protein EV200_101656 [Pedobacter psychrotolerans]GGE41396.1 hypothetical protein GCM10011413_04100 [Pedobacter psychrotolerans]
MNVKDTMLITLPSGKKVIILLAIDKEAVEELYQYLKIDAFQFKKSIAENDSDVSYISAGYKNDSGEIFWEDDLIPIPRWYENN